MMRSANEDDDEDRDDEEDEDALEFLLNGKGVVSTPVKG